MSLLATSSRPAYQYRLKIKLFSCQRESFSTSTMREGHYDTLAVPRNASRSQVKASFYKLSKKYHPDVNKDLGARDRFHAISEAYAVLGDDNQRRAYDLSLDAPTAGTSYPPTSQYWSYEYDSNRRRGATYAWERRHRRQPPPQSGPRPGQGQPYNPRRSSVSSTDPFASPHVRRATGKHSAREAQSDADRIRNESSLWRAAQVIGLVVLVTVIGGGWSAHA